MKKIISLFQRNYDGDRLVRNEVVPGAEWVLNGEGIATEKIDGTCCLIKDGELYKRYDAKKGKIPPKKFIPAQDPDELTGHWPGWLKCDENNPSDKWHFDGLDHIIKPIKDGTYELIGPKVQGNKYNLEHHELIKHGEIELMDIPSDFNFESIKDYLQNKRHIEGIVWHHRDGRMVKIKSKDFGIKW